MNKSKSCTICKHLGRVSSQIDDFETGFLFDGVYQVKPVKIKLCRNHAVDLFQMGQKRFLLQNSNILNDLVSSDEMEFIKILEKTVFGGRSISF